VLTTRGRRPRLAETSPCVQRRDTNEVIQGMNDVPSSGTFRRRPRAFPQETGLGFASASLATMLEARQAPAHEKILIGHEPAHLLWSHFVPRTTSGTTSREGVGRQERCPGARGPHPHLELPARLAAEFAAGSGARRDLQQRHILTGSTQAPARRHRHLGAARQRSGEAGIPPWSGLGRQGRWYAIPDYYICCHALGARISSSRMV